MRSFRLEGERHEYFDGGRLIEPDGSYMTLAYRQGENGAEGFRKVRELDKIYESDMIVDTEYILGESPSLSQEIIDEVRQLEQIRKELKGLE